MYKDVFGKPLDIINKKLWLFDMDGTIYKDHYVFDGSLDLLNEIKENGGRYVFITNNSSKSVNDYIDMNNSIGIPSDYENYFTSSQATIIYLKKYYPNAKVYCQGTNSLIRELISAGINVTQNVEKVDVVLVGFDTEMTSLKIRNTCEILATQDVAYIATNPDLVCPVSFGFIPDCGSICYILNKATGKNPLFIGKPEATMVNTIIEKYGYDLSDTIVIGDRLYTDILTGINAGVTTVCVLTGEATVEDIKCGNIKPTYTVNSVLDLFNTISDNH